MQLLKSILENDRQALFAKLVDAIKLEYSIKNDEWATRIATWLADNGTDRDVEEFLYNYYFNDMPYGIQSDDASEWIGNRVAKEFAQELKGL